MSTYYRPRTPLKLDDVRKLKEFDVVQDGKDWGFQSKDSFLSVETNSKGFVIDVYRHGANEVSDIFPHIQKKLSVSFISEEETNYDNYRDEESKVYQLRFEDGSTCYRTKSEDDSGVLSLQYNLDGGHANIYNPNDKEKSNAVVVEDSRNVDTISFNTIEHLKDSLSAWLDDTVNRLGGEREVSSKVDDDGKLHLMVHDVILTNPEETGNPQHYYMTVEQVKNIPNE